MMTERSRHFVITSDTDLAIRIRSGAEVEPVTEIRVPLIKKKRSSVFGGRTGYLTTIDLLKQ